MRVLKSFAYLLVIVIMFGCYLFTCEYYDPLQDDFTIFDFDAFTLNIHKDIESKDELTVTEMVPLAFGNIFSVRYKNYRIAGYFCVFALFISYSIVFLIMSKFCKKTTFETLRERDDRIIYFMSSILLGLMIVMCFILTYNLKFVNNNKAHESYLKSSNTAFVEVIK